MDTLIGSAFTESFEATNSWRQGSYEPIHYRLSSYNAENDQNDNVDAQIRELLSLEVKVLKEERQQLRRDAGTDGFGLRHFTCDATIELAKKGW